MNKTAIYYQLDGNRIVGPDPWLDMPTDYMTEAEWLKANPPQEPEQPTADQLADTVRAERDRLIESFRWRIERHKDELKLGREPTEPLEPLLQYVQDLRDVPQQAGFPGSVGWPQCP